MAQKSIISLDLSHIITNRDIHHIIINQEVHHHPITSLVHQSMKLTAIVTIIFHLLESVMVHHPAQALAHYHQIMVLHKETMVVAQSLHINQESKPKTSAW